MTMSEAVPGGSARTRLIVALLCTGLLCSLAGRVRAADDLEQYVAAPDSSYSWHQVSAGRIGSCEFVEAVLTSQTWHGIAWKHQLFIIKPARLEMPHRQAFLFIDGGSWHPEYEHGIAGGFPSNAEVFEHLAEVMRAPVAIVRQVPFEPMFGLREDALVAYTFDQYLKSGEGDWPLLLPMAKSASRAMDAVQQLALEHWGIPIERFTVAGASKRGWTSWLVAAIDPRVASVAPMVIAMLDVPAQIELQRQTFGALSQQVHDYEAIHLPERLDSPLGRALVSIVDPYSYRARLTMPKLILLGTNDPYWPVDALKIYWNGLLGEKRVVDLPNQTHDLRDSDRLIGSLSALYRYSARDQPLPELSWSFERSPEELELSVRTNRNPARVLAWTATSASRDFRESRWISHSCEGSDGGYRCSESLAGDHYTGLYAELFFEDPQQPLFSFSTIVCVAKGGKPGAPPC
jgi:PhoPQ-activated pathogenicity-related protein